VKHQAAHTGMRVQNGPNQLIASLASQPPRAAEHAPYRVGHLLA